MTDRDTLKDHKHGRRPPRGIASSPEASEPPSDSVTKIRTDHVRLQAKTIRLSYEPLAAPEGQPCAVKNMVFMLLLNDRDLGPNVNDS